MKKLSLSFIFILTLLFASGLWAQTELINDEFDNGDGLWNSGWIDTNNTTVAVSIDNTGKLSGANSYLLDITSGGTDTWLIQRVANCPLKPGMLYTVSFMAVADQDDAMINVLFEIAGDPYTKRLNEMPTITTTPQVFTFTMSSSETVADNQLKLHFGSPVNDNTKIWIDSIVVTEEPNPAIVSQWGLVTDYNTLWPILNDADTPPGDASMGGEVMSGWRGLQGGFGEDLTITTTEALVVTGQIEFEGGAPAADAYTPLRYALTYQDSNSTLINALTDSATWSHQGNHFGYEFTPRTGNGTEANGGGGAGTVWTINNGNWASTWSNGGGPIASVMQAPRNANMVEGVYDFAISVISVDDTTNMVSWYMIEENNAYWFGGTIMAPSTTKKFNSIIFGTDAFEGTALNLIAVQVDKGDPIVVPKAPWQDFYVADWGFIGDRLGGWTLTPGELDGNVTIGGAAAPTDWSAVRGGFGLDAEPEGEDALIVEGSFEMVGGGFDAWSSLRCGLFNMGNPGTLDSTDAGWAWNGDEAGSYGYLLLPLGGDVAPVDWQGVGQSGTFGAVVDRPWISTNGANDYVLGSSMPVDKASSGAGEYDFAISVQAMEDGTAELRFVFEKDDGSWKWGGVATDDHDPLTTTTFNSVCFAVNNNPGLTALNLIDVQVKMGAPVTIPDWVSVESKSGALPEEFALSQNYPNPFNPTTSISFALPKSSEVRLTVYNAQGRLVRELTNGNMDAGYHHITFDAQDLASGVYFYKIKAGDFVDVKKLMLMK